MQRPIKSIIEPIAFRAGVDATREIPLSVYRRLSCNLVLNATFLTATFGIEDLLKLITNIDISVNGSNSVIKTPLNYFYLANYLKNQGVLSYDLTSTDGTRNINFKFDIDFTVPFGFKPEDALLDIRNATTAILKVRFGNPPAGVTINSGSLYLDTDEYIFQGVQAESIDTYRTFEQDHIQSAIDRIGKMKISIPRGFDMNYYRLIFEVFDENGARSNAELGEISLVSGSTTFAVQNADRLQQDNIVNYKIAKSNWITGQYILELTREGRLTQMLGTEYLAQLDLVLDCIATGGVANIYFERIGRDMDSQLGIKKQIQVAPVK